MSAFGFLKAAVICLTTELFRGLGLSEGNYKREISSSVAERKASVATC